MEEPSTTTETDVKQRIYIDERESLNQMELESSGRFDKWILTLSSGALAISITFLEKIAPKPDPSTLGLLYWGWGALVLTTLLALSSHLTSQSAIRRERKILDERRKMEIQSEESPSQEIKEVSDKNTFSFITHWLNVGSMILFVVGVIIICIFSIENVSLKAESQLQSSTTQTGDVMGKKESGPTGSSKGVRPTGIVRDSQRRVKGGFVPPTSSTPVPTPKPNPPKDSNKE